MTDSSKITIESTKDSYESVKNSLHAKIYVGRL